MNYREEAKMNARSAENELSAFCNCMGSDYDAFAEWFCKDHRTLQENMFELMLRVIYKLADQTEYDDRNEYAVLTSRKIKSCLEK